jgi:hypothetical protein
MYLAASLGLGLGDFCCLYMNESIQESVQTSCTAKNLDQMLQKRAHLFYAKAVEILHGVITLGKDCRPDLLDAREEPRHFRDQATAVTHENGNAL